MNLMPADEFEALPREAKTAYINTLPAEVQEECARLGAMQIAADWIVDHPPAEGLEFWGSDCLECGNTTPDSMECSECARLDFTVPLWRSVIWGDPE